MRAGVLNSLISMPAAASPFEFRPSVRRSTTAPTATAAVTLLGDDYLRNRAPCESKTSTTALLM